MSYQLVENLAATIVAQPNSIVSKTVHADSGVKVVLMALDAGQELSEHTASMPAHIQLLGGEARVTLGDETHNLSAGAWVHMDADERHSVVAISPVILLLTLLKRAAGSP